VLEAYRFHALQRGGAQRFETWLSAGFSDDAAYAEEYALEAKRDQQPRWRAIPLSRRQLREIVF